MTLSTAHPGQSGSNCPPFPHHHVTPIVREQSSKKSFFHLLFRTRQPLTDLFAPQHNDDDTTKLDIVERSANHRQNDSLLHFGIVYF